MCGQTAAGRPVSAAHERRDASDGSAQPGEVDRLLLGGPAHVDARRRAKPAECDDGPDLAEGPQPTALLDKGKDARDLCRTHAIPGRGAARGGQNPSGLGEPYRLAAGSALLGKLADEKSPRFMPTP